jgi:hypothetical protein
MATDTLSYNDQRLELEAADALREMLKVEDDNEFELVEDERKRPAYPLLRELAGYILPGQPKYHPTPLRVKDGVLEDKMYDGNGNKIYKARPLPLRCESCNIECDSYASFTEHCIIPSHKAKLDPSTQFDPRLLDPRYNDPRYAGDAFWAMSSVAKVEAMRTYKKDMIDWFEMSCPSSDDKTKFSQYAAWDQFQNRAKEARWNVKHNFKNYPGRFGLSKKKDLMVVLRKCTAENASDTWLGMVISDFEEMGLMGFALDVVEHGWGELECHGSSSWLTFLAGITELDY